MIAAVGVTNLILGFVYVQYGTMTVAEMIRNRRALGFSHFGAAWIAMAFTCGPHHFVHGFTNLFSGHGSTFGTLGGAGIFFCHASAASLPAAPAASPGGGVLDLIAVAVGFPAGVIWFALRVEAFRRGRGDRFIAGTPIWVIALPTLFGIYITALIAASLGRPHYSLDQAAIIVPNLLLIPIYGAIGYTLARTQIHNRRPLGGWSLSGLALAVIFPTCALMHGAFALYTMTGTYSHPGALAGAIDWLAVPAGLYFLWVVHALNRGRFTDWNAVRRHSSAYRAPSPASAAASGGP